MAPKRGVKYSTPDWSWVGTEVETADQITPLHRRRAAGLVGGVQCPFSFRQFNGEAEDGIEVTKVIRSVKDTSCSDKKCKYWHRCYNHLGAEKLLEKGAKEAFILEKLGPGPELRNGPPGLRNLGATCYANAFLQLWFRNIAFRNGVYSCMVEEGTPLDHLALVFASLQLSDKMVVGPDGFGRGIEAGKRLSAGCCGLFMSLIASEFSQQPDPLIKSLVKDQFEGTLEYVTQCNACSYQSKTTTTFLELELCLKSGASLQDCIARLETPETLDGDNRYNCPQCNTLSPATRTTHLTSLPPVIHFSLLRFVFDPSTMSRKKVKATITYPQHFDLHGDQYNLRAIITHQGTSAHHGHFLCEVYEEEDGEWYLCNDEEVTKKGHHPPKKKPKLDPDAPENTEESKDAYKLIFWCACVKY